MINNGSVQSRYGNLERSHALIKTLFVDTQSNGLLHYCRVDVYLCVASLIFIAVFKLRILKPFVVLGIYSGGVTKLMS